MAYIGWEIPQAARARLMSQFPPVYPDVIGHHITLQFGVPNDAPPPDVAVGRVVGVADDGVGVQALVVEVDGTTDRPDGSTFHCTWSIDRASGRKPVDSNAVIRAQGWTSVPDSFPIRLVPKLFR